MIILQMNLISFKIWNFLHIHLAIIVKDFTFLVFMCYNACNKLIGTFMEIYEQ